MTFLSSLTTRDLLTLAVFAVVFALCFVPLMRRKARKPPTPEQRVWCSDQMAEYRKDLSARQPDRRGNWTDREE